MGALRDAPGTEDTNATDAPSCVERLLRVAAGMHAADVPILNDAQFDGESGAQQPSRGLCATTTWEQGGQAEFEAIKDNARSGRVSQGSGTKRLASVLLWGGGAGRCFVYIKFFGAEREEKTGGRSESGAHATDGLDED